MRTMQKMVPTSGIEPPSFSVKGRCPNQLDDVGKKWMGLKDLNLHMATSKDAALPLCETPIKYYLMFYPVKLPSKVLVDFTQADLEPAY